MHALAPSVPADVRALLDSLGIAATVPSGPASPARAPERVLGQALSLPETVQLADQSSRPLPPLERCPGVHREALLQQAAQRLTLLRQRIERSYAEAFCGKDAPPDAARLMTLLADSGGTGGRTAAIQRAAAALAHGYAELFESTLATMQREVDLLMEATRGALRRVDASRSGLLALDRLLDPVITRELRQAQRRIGRAYARSCEVRIEAALRELETGWDAPALAALFAPRGVLGRLLHDARRLILALLDLEWSMVPTLLEAVCAEHDVHLRTEGPR